MKRTLFFWIDKLKIKRSERIALTACMVITLSLSGTLLWVDFSHEPDGYDYSRLEQVFLERSEQQKQEHDIIMARYGIDTEESSEILLETEVEPDQEIVKSYKMPELEASDSDTTRININHADAEELQRLPGIGPAYASRIVEWRAENGKFQSVDQLLEIRGIGPARLKNIRSLVEL